ncbi:polymorphic outer membrane protein middle domain-containing protein [Chlamydia pecorum]|uniref:polymorphic outer membrane protein middle domain-containing protein n=2 Tax=Chlamydia pecorum TaxID=85991 RepID=UPI003524030A
MKWLSATAIFAAAIPSITAFGEPNSVDLTKNYNGKGYGSEANFTQTNSDANGTTYSVLGDITFSEFTNIPETDSNTTTRTTKNFSLYSNLDPLLSSFSSHIFHNITYFPYLLDTSSSATSTTSPTTTTTPTLTTTGTSTLQEPKGGGAFYNAQENALITFITNAGNPGSLTCKDIKMTGQGAAIYSLGPVLIDGLNSVAFNNNLSQQSGGAIFASSLTITNIINSITFSSNSASVPAPKETTEATTPSPTATTSTSTTTGTLDPKTSSSILHMPIFASSSEKTTLKDSHSSYTQETAGNGGAIYSKEKILLSKYKDALFNKNSTTIDPKAEEAMSSLTDLIRGSGGAIFSVGSLSLQESTGTTSFLQNTAQNAGGAIYGISTITFDDLNTLKFQSNTAQKEGGAIYSKGALTFSNSTVLNAFLGNTSILHGGAVYSEDNITFNNLVETRFKRNKAGDFKATPDSLNQPDSPVASTSSSGQKDNSVPAHILQSLFVSSTSSPSTDASAAAVDGDVTTTQTPGTESHGGAIYAKKNVSITGITSMLAFIENQATGSGGGAYIEGSLTCTNSHRLQFVGNSAKQSGGGLYCKSDVTLKNLTGQTLFQENSAEQNGGGICLDAEKSLILDTLDNFVLQSNTSSQSGGGAYIPKAFTLTHTSPEPDAEFLPVYGAATIIGNSASENGGGIFSKLVSFSNLSSITIDANKATKSGGGLFSGTEVQTTASSQPVAKKPAASYHIMADADKKSTREAPEENADCNFDYTTNVTITNNTAGQNGGGLYGSIGAFNRIDALTIQGNSATQSGGALYFAESLNVTKIVNGTFSGNSAKQSGGGIYAKALTLENLPGEISLSDNTLDNASPTTMLGGGIYAETCTLKNISGTFLCSKNKINDTSTTDGTQTQSQPQQQQQTPLQLQGGGIYAKTSFTLQNCSGELIFSENSVKTAQQSTTKQISGGAIYSPVVSISGCKQPISFLSNSASTSAETPTSDATKKDSFGGAIGATTSITLSDNSSITFSKNYAEMGGAIGCYNSETNGNGNGNGKVTISNNNLIRFDGNSALKRGGAIYAGTLEIPNGNVTFQNNTSKYDGSAIYCTKSATITAGSTILFLGNTVTAAATTAASGSGNTSINNLGAAIYGANGSSDVPITLKALSGDIIFKDNQCTANGGTKYCSIAGDVKLDLKATTGRTIAFYDAVNISTKNGQTQNLDINKAENGTTYEGTVLFSGEYHENKSFIPQKVTLHNGTLVLGKNAELNVISFKQEEGTTVVLGPGAILSNHQKEAGNISLNNVVIDFSGAIPTKENPTASAPTLRLVTRTPPPQPQVNDTITLSGTLYLDDPHNNVYNNPYLGEDREITLFNVSGGTINANDLQITGNLGAKKGYMGTWSSSPTSDASGIKLKWTFDKFLRWEYIPREHNFYINSIWGAQQSLVAVKQGLINNMLSNARFDDAAFNNLWISGIGTFLRKEQGDSPSYTYHGRGLTVAIDAKPRPDFILGASFSKILGHSHSENNLNNYKHKSSDHSLQASLYTGQAFYIPFRYSLKRPLLFQGILTYGYMQHDTTTTYPSINEKNIANWGDRGWLCNARFSFDLKEPSQSSTSRFSIYGEAEYTEVRQEKFTELDYDPRFFGPCAYRNLAFPIGAFIEGALSTYNILLYHKLSAAFLPVFYRNKPISSYKILSTGQIGNILGVIPTRSAVNVEYSQQMYLGSYWTIYGTYSAVASQYTLIQTVNGGLRFVF